MKRSLPIFLFLILSLMYPASFSLMAAEDTTGKFAILIDLSTDVKISHDGASKWQVVHKGDFLAEGDWIMTGSASKATIGFDPSLLNTITLQENSKARVDQLRNTMTLELPEGTVTSLMNGLKPGEEFQVQTPTAVIGVRGTGFIIQVAPGGSTTVVQVEEGSVEVQQTNADQQPTGQKAEASPGQSVEVTSSSVSKKAEDPVLDKLWREHQEELGKLKKTTPEEKREKNIEYERRILKEKIKLLRDGIKKINQKISQLRKEKKLLYSTQSAPSREGYENEEIHNQAANLETDLKTLYHQRMELYQQLAHLKAKLAGLSRPISQAPLPTTVVPQATAIQYTAPLPVPPASVPGTAGTQRPAEPKGQPVQTTTPDVQ